jgi:HlyD family secretion protein
MTATADIIVQHLQNALLIPNAALRFTPPPSLKAAGQKKSFVRSLLPGPPARTPKKKQEEAKAPRNEHTIWVLKGTTPTAVTIKTGATDGRHTVVLGGDLQAGMKVITATLEQDKTTP